MTFKAEFAPAAIDAAVATAGRFNAAMTFLERIMADAKAELQQISEIEKTGTPYEKQFNPARAAEAYVAYNHAADYLKLVNA